jgi:hypothetical protein
MKGKLMKAIWKEIDQKGRKYGNYNRQEVAKWKSGLDETCEDSCRTARLQGRQNAVYRPWGRLLEQRATGSTQLLAVLQGEAPRTHRIVGSLKRPCWERPLLATSQSLDLDEERRCNKSQRPSGRCVHCGLLASCSRTAPRVICPSGRWVHCGLLASFSRTAPRLIWVWTGTPSLSPRGASLTHFKRRRDFKGVRLPTSGWRLESSWVQGHQWTEPHRSRCPLEIPVADTWQG